MKQPERKTILDMECVNREKAADMIGMSVSSLDKLLASTRSKRAKVPIRFIQYAKNGPVWFPIPWLQEFVSLVGDSAGIIA